mmetsp:Transcript_108017/g.344384  ORF Transcript_108017/g.344384 Transcript_108017/m.344384 type:complete len:129 (-) Transcript_108017:59-445(-)
MLARGAKAHPHAPLMRALAAAMADERLPADGRGASPQDRVDAAAEALRLTAGEHVLADAAATVALFAAMTVTVDAAGHSSWELGTLAPVASGIAGLRARAEGLALPAALLAAAGLGAAIGARLARRGS